MVTAGRALAARALDGSGRSPETMTASRPEVERLDAVGEDLPVERLGIDLEERGRAEVLLPVGRVRLHEMLREKRHVVGPVAQRGERHGDRVDAIVQVLAELAGAHRLREIAVGRGHDAYVHPARPRATDAEEG